MVVNYKHFVCKNKSIHRPFHYLSIKTRQFVFPVDVKYLVNQNNHVDHVEQII